MKKKRKRDGPLSLDKYRLDYEAERQSDLYGTWARRMATAKGKVRLLEADLKLLTAQLKLAIRQNPGKYGFGSRPSDKAVEARAETVRDYVELLREINELKNEQDQYEVIVKGLDHKKAMVENLCFLNGQSYYARPRTAETPRPKMMRRGRKREPD